MLLWVPVAHAGGVVEDVLPALMVLGAALTVGALTAGLGLILAPVLFTTLAGTAIVGGLMIGAGLLAADCISGGSPFGDPDFVCKGGNGGVGGGGGAIPLSVVSSTSASPTCTSLTLSGIDSQGHNYAILRDGAVIANLPASQTSYTDTNLTPHTSYEYWIRVYNSSGANPVKLINIAGAQARGGGGAVVPVALPVSSYTDSAPLAAYTKCLPQCGFGAKETSVPKFGEATLVWQCNYNAPSADKGSCKIDNTEVSATGGTLSVPVTDSTTYVLSCANVDGTISIPTVIKVLQPGIQEVRP